jgi:hypothetical protein
LKENIKKTYCRLCNSTLSQILISLGNQYVNDFPSNKIEKGRNGQCPLNLVYCETCDLYQLQHTAPQELLYSKHYWYKSSINDTIKKDLEEIANIAIQLNKLTEDEIFLDIGANDGTLLKNIKDKCITVGCEPAINLADSLRDNSHYQINDFWNKQNYINLGLEKAKVITAIGMFYDMEDPNQFISDAKAVLSEDGIFIAQLMTLKPMLENKDLGNICHEHLEYYTYKSLKYLFETNGLEIFKIEENKINGGSYRIFARHFISGSIEYKESISQIDVINFLRDIDEIKLQVKKVLKDLKNSGKKIYAYGASTKGNVILQYFGLSDKDIIAVADKNPEKYGLYTLTDIPIVSEEVARKEANVFFILPYGFTDEFIRREKDWIMNGGTLISPLPNLRIINKENYAD